MRPDSAPSPEARVALALSWTGPRRRRPERHCTFRTSRHTHTHTHTHTRRHTHTHVEKPWCRQVGRLIKVQNVRGAARMVARGSAAECTRCRADHAPGPTSTRPSHPPTLSDAAPSCRTHTRSRTTTTQSTRRSFNLHVGRKTERQAGNKATRQASNQATRQAGRQAGRQATRQAGRQAGR